MASKKVSTRQKMINLMYLVFIAMLALNVPAEVLDGFVLVNDKLQQTIQHTVSRNEQMYAEMNASYQKNPEKTKIPYGRTQEVKEKTDSLFNYIQYLKVEIAKNTDGAEADVNDLQKKDNLDAPSEVMLAPIIGHGPKLRKAINQYREEISTYILDPEKAALVKMMLSTEPTPRAKKDNKNWEESSFGQMPTIAAVTFLSELQSNVKQAEGEALNSLLKSIDVSDFRVNELNAFVIPESNIVMSGSSYKAHIILAAVDTTQRPRIVISGKELPKEKNGYYEVAAGGVGKRTVEGYLEMMGRDGVPMQQHFKREFTVIEPMATVAPLLMDVVYSGIDNPISISVPGVDGGNVRASAQGGTLTQRGKEWIARPAGVGGKFIVSVTATLNGSSRTVATKEFRIRALPNPTAYINYTDAKGTNRTFKQGGLSRTVLLNAGGIKASIDDGILDIPFTVIGFRTISMDAMQNQMQEVSAGANFSERQLEMIRRMDRGKTFFIGGIRVKGPDGVEREISPMEIRVN